MAALQSLLGSVLPHSPLSATSESLSVRLFPSFGHRTRFMSPDRQLSSACALQRGPSTGEQSHRALLDNGAPLETPSFETVTLHVGGEALHLSTLLRNFNPPCCGTSLHPAAELQCTLLQM